MTRACPIVAAFRVIGGKQHSTSNDVVGLASLQSKFDVLQGWGGDPCLPEPYSWEWINCTSDATPRVTVLLSGSLPDSMTALETIDMHNNSISGVYLARFLIFLELYPTLKNWIWLIIN